MTYKSIFTGVIGVLIATASSAQTYPSQPIKLIAPFAAGSTVDIIARTIAVPLGQQLGTSVIVDNRPGAGGVLGMDVVAKAAKDGYTIGLAATSPLSVNPSLMEKMPYDALKDFAPISEIATGPNVLVINPKYTKATNVNELIALGKNDPKALFYGSSGIGTANHLAGVLFSQVAGISMTHVPYKGNGEVLTDLLGGQVQVFFSAIPPVLAQIKSGAVRALVITGDQRDPSLPNVPTVAEVGLTGAEVMPWFGLVAPAGTPQAVITRLHQEIAKVMARPEVRESFQVNGTMPKSTTPEEFSSYLKADYAKWARLIKQANIKRSSSSNHLGIFISTVSFSCLLKVLLC